MLSGKSRGERRSRRHPGAAGRFGGYAVPTLEKVVKHAMWAIA